MALPTTPARALLWRIKASLLDYVRGMPDGSVEVEAPAAAPSDAGDRAFRFPALPGGGDDVLRFAGGVTLTGHSGMLRLVFREPWLESDGEARILSISDPHEPGRRIPLAVADGLPRLADGSLSAVGTRLTAEGAELFLAGPYSAGTPLDDPVVAEARGGTPRASRSES